MHDDVSLQAARSLRSALLVTSFLLIFLAFPTPIVRAAGTTRFVKPSATGAGNCTSWANACTLQYALVAAVSTDQIWLQQGIYKPTPGIDPAATFNLKSGVAVYGGFTGTETALSQRNWATHVTTLSGDLGTAHSFHVVSTSATDSTTRLDGLTITDGQAADGVGGGIYIDGSLTIANCTITNNSGAYGGGIFQEGLSDRLDMKDSVVQLNTATYHGGGLYIRGNVAISNTQVLSNTASFHGGGVHVDSGRADLSGALFTNNRAVGGNGGAININNGISITSTQFISNTSGDLGGALTQWNSGYQVTITGARFERNTTKNKGGGAYVKSPATITNSSFVTNTVDSGGSGDTFGGGVYVSNTVQVQSSTFSGNAAQCTGCGSSHGGGLSAALAATIQNSTFDGNDAWDGGGVYGDSSISVTRSTFKNNTAGYGGGISSLSAVQVDGSDFLNNSVVNRGAGIEAGDLTLSGTRLLGNTARVGGGFSAVNNLSITNALLADNTAINAAAFVAGITTTVRHVTIARATPSPAPAIYLWKSTMAMTDTIVSNYQFAIYQDQSTVSADYDLISTSTPITPTSITLPLAHNLIGVDPQFVNPAAGDYHLTASSPAVDAGTNVGVTVDLDGKPRPLVHGYDMGAYEFGRLLFLPLLKR